MKVPYKSGDVGKISPRIFKTYEPNSCSDAEYFSTSVRHCFPSLGERTRFLNKFYQCLLCGQLLLKTTKLTVVGPSDSGKSSWACVLMGLTQKEKIATISKEKVFNLSLLDDDTQLLFIDEMNGKTLQSDQAKIVLQGGMLTVPVKHEKAKIINNKAGIYITCNELPDFGTEQANVMRRLEVFTTKSLDSRHAEAPNWMAENAMQCLVWIANEINRNINEIEPEELFYQRPYDELLEVKKNQAIPDEELQKLSSALSGNETSSAPLVNDDDLNTFKSFIIGNKGFMF